MSHAPRQRRPLVDRLWEKVDRSDNSDACWLYKNITHNSYGHISYFKEDGTKTSIGAHQAAYLVTHGNIPAGKMVLHTCNQKRCCNPAHLYAGTLSQNAHDAINSGTWEPHKRKLTDEQVFLIRTLQGEYTQAELATQFDVTITTISDILLGKVRLEAGGPLKSTPKKQKTHCIRGHALTDDNVTLTKGGTVRNCRICYAEAQRVKSRRYASRNRDVINARTRARRGTHRHYLSEATCAEIRRLYAAGDISYRALAEQFHSNYSTIHKVIHGTYTSTHLATDAKATP